MAISPTRVGALSSIAVFAACSSFSGPSQEQVQTVDRIGKLISRECSKSEPGPALDRRLAPAVDELIALTEGHPNDYYDPNPTNAEVVEDETNFLLELIYVAQLLAGDEEVRHVCSSRLASRAEAAIREIEG